MVLLIKKEEKMERNKRYIRKEDMSPDGTLTLFAGKLGDITLQVLGYDGASEEPLRAQVIFCTTSNGGGRSPHTRKALMALAEAIEKDNKECPI